MILLRTHWDPNWSFGRSICVICMLVLCAGCHQPPPVDPSPYQPVKTDEPLTRVHIVEHSNLSETITNKERLKEFASRDFLSPQPYRKVLRVYRRDHLGSTRSIITSYYENGQIQQYLECVNGRACGLYLEWYSTGGQKIQAHLVAGQADLDEKSCITWSFEGECRTWNEEGVLVSIFRYEHGLLHGMTQTFYDTGEKRGNTPYDHGKKQGTEYLYYKSGSVLQTMTFVEDRRDGEAIGYTSTGVPLWREQYHNNLLMEAHYGIPDQKISSEVTSGSGVRSLYEDDFLVSQEEIRQGQPEGWITIYDDDGFVERKYEIHDGQKHGVEIRYYPQSTVPRLSISWCEGSIHGTTKTWYENGALESQKEMVQNLKNGLSMGWYPDGGVMLVEEYSNDRLMRGQYMKKGESQPTSSVEKGAGVVTLFDQAGTILEKIRYLDGKPQVDEA